RPPPVPPSFPTRRSSDLNSIFGFLGPNGSGKSTTIKLLLGLIRPTAGSASVFGADIIHDSVAIRQRVGYLAQEPRYYEHLTAREDRKSTRLNSSHDQISY